MLVFAKLAALASASMIIQINQIIPYLKGDEFRAKIAEFISQIFIGFASSFFDVFIQTMRGYFS